MRLGPKQVKVEAVRLKLTKRPSTIKNTRIVRQSGSLQPCQNGLESGGHGSESGSPRKQSPQSASRFR
jgi:hypothetical protein